MDESMGQRIKKLRMEQNMKKTELAEHINRSRTSVARYEEDKLAVPSDVLNHIANFFDVSTDYLIHGTPEQTETVGARRLLEYYTPLPVEEKKELLEIARLKYLKATKK